jgi:hypothetical protein
LYNQFYFLHLDKITAKTAGVRMFDPMYHIMEQNNISALDLNKSHQSHNHWKSFDINTFIFCILRDPIIRTISDFCYWANYGDDGIRTHLKGRDYECPSYTKENLLNWLEAKHVKNYQYKTISDNNPLNINENLSRINMLVRAEDIRGNENLLRESILKKLGIDHTFNYYPPDFENVFMPPNGEIINILHNNPEIFDIIKEYNQDDTWLYSQASSILLLNSENTES